jgi:hypothetical protein
VYIYVYIYVWVQDGVTNKNLLVEIYLVIDKLKILSINVNLG